MMVLATEYLMRKGRWTILLSITDAANLAAEINL
jgi:hypothetical protein